MRSNAKEKDQDGGAQEKTSSGGKQANPSSRSKSKDGSSKQKEGNKSSSSRSRSSGSNRGSKSVVADVLSPILAAQKNQRGGKSISEREELFPSSKEIQSGLSGGPVSAIVRCH